MSQAEAVVTGVPNAGATHPGTTSQVSTFETLPMPGRWHDPLGLMCSTPPEKPYRIVLATVIVLCAAILIWACIGKLDILSSADGSQRLKDAVGTTYLLGAGMRVVAEIRYGDRTVMEYLLSPVQGAVHDAGRER